MAKKAFLLPTMSDFFTVYLPETRGLSENTVRSYRYAFRLLLEYIHEKHGLTPDRIEFRHLENDVIPSWLNWLCDERGCSARTRNQRLAALITFARFTIRSNFEDALSLCSEIERIPKKKNHEREEAVHLTREEMSILLRLPDSSVKTGKRDKILLATLYATGARAQELCDLSVGDIRFGNETTVTLHGKGNKIRIVVIPEKSALLLKEYMAWRFPADKIIDTRSHVFSSQTNEKMTISCVEAIVKKYVRMAKELRPELFPHNYTPHSFRHSIAMHMLESGVPLPVIKTFLGHVSIASTMIYASANFEMVSKYLRDKDPYAEQDGEVAEHQGFVMPQFLR